MRAAVFCLAALMAVATSCTNDYSVFRFEQPGAYVGYTLDLGFQREDQAVRADAHSPAAYGPGDVSGFLRRPEDFLVAPVACVHAHEVIAASG